MKKKICFLVGAGTHYKRIPFSPDCDDFVIAVDGGYDFLKEKKIVPNLIIGDFDSAKTPCQSFTKTVPFISFPSKKDYTDMFLAADEGLKNGFDTFFIYGGTGGRFDHTLANIQLLSYLSEKGARPFMFDKNHILTALTNSSISISSGVSKKDCGYMKAKKHGYISVFSLSDISEGVTVKGLLYNADSITLNRTVSIGTSNEYTGSDCFIEVEHGTLLIISS